jgi:maltose alpha-D-glucosyltransferase/alpha-amylase
VNGEEKSYFLPLSLLWNEQEAGVLSPERSYAIARVRRGSRVGWMLDGAQDPSFVRLLVDKLRAGGSEAFNGGEILFQPAPALLDIPASDAVKLIGAEQSNVSTVVGDAVLLKIYRQLEPGAQPEIEMSRFLTETAGFASSPAFLGSVEHRASTGEATALAAAFRFIPNQGDAWSAVTDALERLLEGYRLAENETDVGLHAFPLGIGGKIGQRTAELHLALATETDDTAFGADPIQASHIKSWVAQARDAAVQAFRGLDHASTEHWGELTVASVRALQQKRAVVEDLLTQLDGIEPSGLAIRTHSDYHLGQLLMVKDDVVIIDFEG